MRETPSRQRLQDNVGRRVWAFDAFLFGPTGQLPLYDRIHPALSGFADGVCRMLAPLSAYLMALALLAIGAIGAGNICSMAPPWSPAARMPGAWPIARRAPSPSASLIFTIKQRLTRFSGIPGRPQGPAPMERRRQEAGRRARDLPPGRRTHPGRPCDRGNRRPDGPGRHARAGGRGVIDSKFGTVTLLRLIGGGERRARLPRLHQAHRRAQSPDLRLVVPGQRSPREYAGPPRRHRLHAEPADAAVAPEMTRNWRNCSPAPNSGAATAQPRPYRPCRRTG